MLDAALREKALDHAWNYFELHANQRMTVFNFFLVLAGLVSAGLAATIQGTPKFAILGVALGLLLTLVSFVFWKLDQRAAFLLKHAEDALAELESFLPVQKGHLFSSEPNLTAAACKKGSIWMRLWTYGQSFRLAFWIIGLFGVSASGISLLRVVRLLSW